MKGNEKLKTIGLIISIIVISFLIIYIFILKMFFKTDNDYQKLGLDLHAYNIDYYTIYDEDSFAIYKVYKLNMFGDKDKIRNMLERTNSWSKEKFYEYVMMRFYEESDKETTELDREDLYYYHKNGIYAIFDMKNSKLYYLKNYLYSTHNNYNTILDIKISDYIKREIYDVRGGLQNDGRDYYVYEFTKQKGEEIIKTLEQSPKWSQTKLEDYKLDNFEYNQQILSIENGYYHYEKVCRTSDENKKHNFTDEEATGCEIGVYDVDQNILYYYWTSN